MKISIVLITVFYHYFVCSIIWTLSPETTFVFESGTIGLLFIIYQITCSLILITTAGV